jgi:hypothetical protein
LVVHYEHPLEVSRRPWQRRIEVYSPKLRRRMTLFSMQAHDAWLLLEADPAVKRFCERPTYVEGKAGALIDFWVDRGRHAQFWILSPSQSEEPTLPKMAHGLRLRIFRRPDLLALSTRIQNWSQIVPYRVTYGRRGDQQLQQDIWTRLERPHRLERLEGAFHPVDSSRIRAAVFELLAAGRVVAPELDIAPLGLKTMFRRRPA